MNRHGPLQLLLMYCVCSKNNACSRVTFYEFSFDDVTKSSTSIGRLHGIGLTLNDAESLEQNLQELLHKAE